MAAPKGNQNAKRKPWADALKRALARNSKDKTIESGLNQIADQVVTAAFNGEWQAQQEVFNRLDGKYAQSVMLSGDDDNPVAIREIPFRSIPVDEDESV